MRPCELCESPGGEVLLEDPAGAWRVVLVEEPDYPGFCRVIAGSHVRENTDLPPEQRRRLLEVVLLVEEAVREVVRPHKVNLASLGNVTPHVHWHVIPRWEDDRCFPASIWAPARREAAPRPSPPDLAARLREALVRRLAGL